MGEVAVYPGDFERDARFRLGFALKGFERLQFVSERDVIVKDPPPIGL